MKPVSRSPLVIIAALVAFFAKPPLSIHAQTGPKPSLVIAAVADAESGAPVPDAEVRLSDVNVSARTDWSGEARIPGVAPGQHRFEIRHSGYQPLDVELLVKGDSSGPVFRLAKLAVSPRALNVAGDPSPYLAEFESRRQQGRGRYLTAAELEQNQNRSLVTVLANAFGGLMSGPDQSRPGHNILLTRRSRPRTTSVDTHCGVDVYLDASQYLEDLDALHPNELAGVEYYPVESAPGAYRKLTDNCGVLLLWSKKSR